ncbi:MAG: FKBP-type peptidyl-prolyl cis-trans isomerase [Chitinophagales bacterium]|nr:FKBP-type peptidyl-prolyl cis-trans isomerase [Chitinophagaceae bacterium]MCB9065601.1 FKBP-type peptidyl-prolyl cis-trans isomerase [Chitinophagales bacterium]
MSRITTIAATLAAFSLGFTACNTDGWKKTDKGVEYKIVKDEPGDKHPAVGDYIKLHMHVIVNDSNYFNSRQMNGNMAFEMNYPEAKYETDWISGLQMLSAGDSAIFRVPIDTAKKYAQGQMPDFGPDEKYVYYHVVLESFATEQEMQQQQMAQQKDQLVKDDEILQAYFKENNITPKKTDLGTYYVVKKEGNGRDIVKGANVEVNYTGKTLDGKTFDSNVDPRFGHTDPFPFSAGQGMVIKGWDDAMMYLKEGSKATFYIPSALAYGPNGMGGAIGPDANLIFDVEITRVDPGPGSEVNPEPEHPTPNHEDEHPQPKAH